MTAPTEPRCELCEEPVLPGERKASPKTMTAHWECMLRAVLGGAGHHEDHDRWCITERDPDAGLSMRDSARRVAQLLKEGRIRWQR